MNKLRVIGFCGLAGSGKDEAANALPYLIDTVGSGWYRMAFANEIKLIAKTCFGWNGEKDKAGRALLQDIGMLGRKYNPDIWINEIRKSIPTAHHCAIQRLAITDVRFPNEAEFIQRELGGKIIRVIRPGQTMEKFHSHVSENEQWKIQADIIIVNDGTIEQLHAKVLEAIE
jgi:hypothetical protein